MKLKMVINRGDVYGRLTIIQEAKYMHYKDNGRIKKLRRFKCLCDCGKQTIVFLSNLRSGITKSCGCLREEIITKHGMNATSEYKCWQNIRERCNNKKYIGYYNYGGRGITVCDRWMKFENFYKDMRGKPGPEYSIDRIDNDGNYEPENCRWATQEQQANNRSSNVLIKFKNKTQNIKQWSNELGINYGTLQKRIEKGWPIEKAFIKTK